jgi:hypothetical protein
MDILRVLRQNSIYSLYQDGPGSSVGIATGYGLDGPGIESRRGWDFPHLSRPALGPTQPPVQWVPSLSPGVKSGRGVTLTPQTFLVPWSRKSRAIPLIPQWAVRPVQSLNACTRVQFTIFFTFISGLDACEWLNRCTVNMTLAHVRTRTFRSVRYLQLFLNTLLPLSELCVLLSFCAAGDARGVLKRMFLCFLIMKDTRRGN